MEDIKKLLGLKIKNLRTRRGYSQQKLAEIINIDQRNLSNIECGNTFPTRHLLRIARGLKVTLPELFDFDYIPQNTDNMKKFIIKNLENMSEADITTIYRMITVMK